MKQLIILLTVFFTINCFATNPDWTINSSDYVNSMQMVSVVKIDGVELTGNNHKIAAFVNGTCRGVASSFYSSATKQYVFYLFVYSNKASGENITFKVFNNTTGMVYNATNSVAFQVNEKVGSVSKPYTISNQVLKSEIEYKSGEFIENVPQGTSIGTFVDWENGDAVMATFSFVDGGADNEQFIIDGSKLKTNAMFNFENKSEFNIKVQSVSNYGIKTKSIELLLQDENEAPTAISLSQNTLSENVESNYFIGEISATDVDINDTFSYKLLSGKDHFFIMGNLLFSKSSFNYEQQTKYPIQIQVSDKGDNTFTQDFEIFIADVNDAPQNITLHYGKINTGLPAGIMVGSIFASDEDLNDVVNCTLVEGALDNSDFMLQDDGTLVSAKTFELPEEGNKHIRVLANDLNGGEKTTDLVIEVNNEGYSYSEKHINVTFTNSDVVVQHVELDDDFVDVEIKPNGFGLFTVTSSSKVAVYALYNAEGKQLVRKNIEKNTFELNVGKYTSGVYFLNIRTLSGVVTEKIVISE